MDKFNNNRDIYIDDLRLRMTVGGRFLVRIVSSGFYLIMIATVFTFIISDVGWLKWLGVFMFLFLIDRLIHLREAARSIKDLSRMSRVNIADYLTPKAFLALERSLDRSYFTKRNLFLGVARQLIGFSEITETLKRLGVNPDEFKQKADEFLEESAKTSEILSRKEYEDQVLVIGAQAFKRAVISGRPFVDIGHVFSSLAFVGDEMVANLFSLFFIDSKDFEFAFSLTYARKAGFINYKNKFLEKEMPVVGVGLIGVGYGTIEMAMAHEALLIERSSKIKISPKAIRVAILFARKYARGMYVLPKTIEILRESFESAERRGETQLTESRVISTVEEQFTVFSDVSTDDNEEDVLEEL
jgi:hypothetical protein